MAFDKIEIQDFLLLGSGDTPYLPAVKLRVQKSADDQLDIMVSHGNTTLAGFCFSLNDQGRLIVSAWHTEEDGTQDDCIIKIGLDDEFLWHKVDEKDRDLRLPAKPPMPNPITTKIS